jgi:hypothetical protein
MITRGVSRYEHDAPHLDEPDIASGLKRTRIADKAQPSAATQKGDSHDVNHEL